MKALKILAGMLAAAAAASLTWTVFKGVDDMERRLDDIEKKLDDLDADVFELQCHTAGLENGAHKPD